MSNTFLPKQSLSTIPPPVQEITVVYQRPGTYRPEIQLFPIQTHNIESHQLAYSKFKSAICRLFQLPKSTPFMLKDQVAGAKMTRERYSEFLTRGKFPVVWKLVTAVPGEEGGKRSLATLQSFTSEISQAGEIIPEKSRSKSSSCVVDAPSVHLLARTLSLGWNEHTNTYGLETQCIKVDNKQLVFISKRSQSLSLPADQSGLSVGDVILKIEGHPVGEMPLDEIGLHLNYPQAKLASLNLSVLPWTEAPPEIKEVILKTLDSGSSQSAVSLLSPPEGRAAVHSHRLPGAMSDPNFCSIPVSTIDDPLFPQPIKSPGTSPTRRKNRHPQMIGSPGEVRHKMAPPSSPSKMIGFLTGNKSRNRHSSSCSRSDSFAYIPSFPEPTTESADSNQPNADPILESSRSAGCILESDQSNQSNGLEQSADFDQSKDRLPRIQSADFLLEPTSSMDTNMELNPFSPLADKPELNEFANSKLELTLDSIQESIIESNLNSEQYANMELSIGPEPMIFSEDMNPELTILPNFDLRDSDPEKTIVPITGPELVVLADKPEPTLTADFNSEPTLTADFKLDSPQDFELETKEEKLEPTLTADFKPEPTLTADFKLDSPQDFELETKEEKLEPTLTADFRPEPIHNSEGFESEPKGDKLEPNLTADSKLDSPQDFELETKEEKLEPNLTADFRPEPIHNSQGFESEPKGEKLEPTFTPNVNSDLEPKLNTINKLEPIVSPQEPTQVPNEQTGTNTSISETNPQIGSMTGSNKFRRTVSDPNANTIFPGNSRLNSDSSSSLDTEDISGMYYIIDPPIEIPLSSETDTFQTGTDTSRIETYNLVNPFQPFKDPSPPKKVSKNIHKGVDRQLFASSEFPKVTDGSETIVSSSCTEFINPAFQGSVHGVYHPLETDQSIISRKETGMPELYGDFGYSTDESDYEDSEIFASRRQTAGLATPLRPRKFPSYNPDKDPRPNSEIIQRSTSEASNLTGSARFFKENSENNPRIRMARKQKAMMHTHQRTNSEFSDGESNLYSPEIATGTVKPVKPRSGARFLTQKPAEFVHPAYRQYSQIGNMEINERMCAKLREKFQPINSGPLSRKQEMDGRLRKRAADRSWKNFYVHLLESDLIFYKSEKDFLSDKPFLNVLFMPGTERHFLYDHIVSLHHARLLIPNDYMSQKRSCSSYVFRLQTENTTCYLMRAISLPLMFGWLLSFIEARKLPPTDNPYPIGLFQEPDKRRFSSIEGANRYFQRIQQKVRSKLNFTRRDSEIVLDPIFSSTIQGSARSRENEKIPLLVEMCVREIEERALETDGIYRVSGTARHIRSLRDDLSKGAEIDRTDERWLDENNVAGLLKMFFKELTEPLVSPALYDSLVTEISTQHDSQGQLIRSLQLLLLSMPETHFSTLDYLVAHLCRVAQCSGVNRMSIKNLAIVFGPTLITRRDLKGIQLICQTNAQVTVMEMLITHYDHIFNCQPIPNFLFDSKRAPSIISHRGPRGSISNVNSDRFRRVSSSNPPFPQPSLSPPPPYQEHLPLESKLSRSWSEEVLTRVNLVIEGTDLSRMPPNSLFDSVNSLNRRSSIGSRESATHPLSNTLWHIPFENMNSGSANPCPERREKKSGRSPTFL